MRIAQVEEAIAGAPAAQGYLALTGERGPREYLLGPRTDTDAMPPLLDWRSAPLAEAFFRAGEGEPFELERGDQPISGTVTARFVIAEHGRVLVGDEVVWRKHDDGWREQRVLRPAPAAGAPIDRSALPVLDP